MSSRYNPDEININDLTDFIHAMSTSSTSSSTYDTTATSSSTSFALLQDEEPQYRSIIFPEDTHTHQSHPHQHINPKELQDVNISLDSFGISPSIEAAEYFAANARFVTPTTPPPLSHISSLHPPSSIFSPHTPPSFEQQASTHSLPPSSPTLSTDSSSSSSLSQSYSQSHLDSELPTHDALMRNDSCISVYHEISHRRDDEIDVVEDDDTCDNIMPDADSDELPPPGVYPRLMRQNGIYRQPSIAGY